MAVLTSTNFGALLYPGLRKIYDDTFKQLPDYLKEIYSVNTSSSVEEKEHSVGEFGLMEEWTGQVKYDTTRLGWEIRYIHKKYSNGFIVERELYDDERYGVIRKRPKALARSVFNTRQIHAASLFNNAFSSSYPIYDGQPLISDSHPDYPGASTYQSNLLNLALTADNLEQARIAMMEFKDDRRNLIGVNPDTLIVPPALRQPALEIVQSEGKPDTTDNNVNIHKGQYKVIVWPFLTDSTAWFLMDKQLANMFLQWFDRRVPKLEQEDDFNTEQAYFKVVGRWSFGVSNWRFLIGSKPA